MGYFLAVANRKGGVGKSTISVMLAQAFAVLGGRKVLLIDLDSQANSSLILLGGEQWIGAQRTSKTVAAFIEDRLYGKTPMAEYLLQKVGDVMDAKGRPPAISLLTGSLDFEDIQDELITHYSRHNTPFRQAKLRCAGHLKQALTHAKALADVIILDCAPGLSNATQAALQLASKIIVPFRPDAVSEFAVDRISSIIEGKPFGAVIELPKEQRRYACVANYVREGGRDQTYIDTISFNHPTLATRIPMLTDLANAFDWGAERQSLQEKYGAAYAPLTALYEDVRTVVQHA
jgi:cellulose biosynthesis protein BcsQ